MSKHYALAPFEVKSASVDGNVGRFAGYLSVFGVKDLAGDIVEQGAFTKTLRDEGNERPLLWQHMWHEPVGLLRLEEDHKGLKIDGEVDLDINEGKRTYSGITKKYCKGMSIGYDVKADRIEKAARHLTELKLWEGSIVTFPCLPIAQAHAKSIATLLQLPDLVTAGGPAELKAYAELMASIRSSAYLSPEKLEQMQSLLEQLNRLFESPDQKAAREAADTQTHTEAARGAAAETKSEEPPPQGEFDAEFYAALGAFHTTVKSAAQELR